MLRRGNQQDCNQLVGYEQMVEDCFPGRPAIGMCQYPIESFPPQVLKAILGIHRKQVVDPVVPCSCASLQVRNGYFSTEIVTDRFLVNPHYYYVVEDEAKHEVQGWGTASRFEVATQRAENLIRRLALPSLSN